MKPFPQFRPREGATRRFKDALYSGMAGENLKRRRGLDATTAILAGFAGEVKAARITYR